MKSINVQRPKVSILIIGRNTKDELPRLLKSFKKLTYPRRLYEIVFVDDGSTDESWKIAEQFGARVFRFMKRQGRARVRNKALKMARYPIIAWIDSDCEIQDPHWIENMLKYLKGDVIGVAGDQLKPLGGLSRVIWYMPGMAYLAKKPKEVSFAPTTSSLFVKKPLLEIGGFDEKLITAEDLELCWRLGKKGYKFMQIPKAAITHHFRSSFKGFAKQQWERGVFGGYLFRKYGNGIFAKLMDKALFFMPLLGIAILLWPQLLLAIAIFPLFVYLGLNYVNSFPAVIGNYYRNEKSLIGVAKLIVAQYIKTFTLIGGLLQYQLQNLKR
jgi:glycosyltransferase involved in cell wall biosynthesis